MGLGRGANCWADEKFITKLKEVLQEVLQEVFKKIFKEVFKEVFRIEDTMLFVKCYN